VTGHFSLPTGGAGQALALSILGLLLASGYLGVVAPVLDLYAAREATLADRRMLAQRLDGVTDELASLHTRLAELQAAANARDIALDAASDAIAVAKLQSRVGELAAAASIAIASSESLPAENRPGYRRIGLRLTVDGDYDGIVKLLGAVETATPPVITTNLRIRGVLRRAAETANGRVEGGFEIYAFRRTGTSTAAAQ
jgi:hypothetical protein